MLHELEESLLSKERNGMKANMRCRLWTFWVCTESDGVKVHKQIVQRISNTKSALTKYCLYN